MKRIWICVLLLALIAGSAQAALDYNTFFDDTGNGGRFDSFAWDGTYFYWLHAPQDSMNRQEFPANLYRMKPGQPEAELLLPGRDDFWMWDLYSIGDRLLISAADDANGQTHPVVLNPESGACKALAGNIGSVVLEADRIYNCADGAIYEIDINSMKPKKIYTYPADIAADNPILIQKIGLNLYFTTDRHDWYRLDLQFDSLEKICTLRGDGFVRDFKFYIGDYDGGGTWRYDLATGERAQISDHTYMFLQGNADCVMAQLLDPAGLGSAEGGRIFDLTWLTDDLQHALIGACDPLHDCLLGGLLAHYDAENNRMDWSTDPVVQFLNQ